MTPNKAWFESLKDEGGVVYLGNNQPCQVKGIGSVRVRMHNGVKKLIANVRFIPELKRNLISLGMLDKLRFAIKIEARTVKIMKGSLLVMKGIKKNGIYSCWAAQLLGHHHWFLVPI